MGAVLSAHEVKAAEEHGTSTEVAPWALSHRK